MNYYNEFDKGAAQWLRNLIAAGLIPNGDVDERSITEVQASELIGYTQCHFFAGIGGWSLALQLAGWPATRSVWTGSCPCQPYSAAGKQLGDADERNLWPILFNLISQCRPDVVFGEQVESAIGHGWLDGISTDLEGEGYACGRVVLGAHSLGAPHIRQRLWWVGHTSGVGHERFGISGESAGESAGEFARSSITGASHSLNGRLSNTDVAEFQKQPSTRHERIDGKNNFILRGLSDADSKQRNGITASQELQHNRQACGRIEGDSIATNDRGCNSGWGDNWVACADGKARRIEPGPCAMVDGLPAALVSLRPEQIQQIENEVFSYAAKAKIDAGEAVRNVWSALAAESVRESPGRLSSVCEAPFLLAFMLQLSRQGWAFAESVSSASAETAEEILRGVRCDHEAPRSSHRPKLDEQHGEKHPDALCVLSSILALNASSAWGDSFDPDAVHLAPLIHGSPARVVRLRGYGNAIVPQVAAEFISAFLECAA